jgi:hypothetical protein
MCLFVLASLLQTRHYSYACFEGLPGVTTSSASPQVPCLRIVTAPLAGGGDDGGNGAGGAVGTIPPVAPAPLLGVLEPAGAVLAAEAAAAVVGSGSVCPAPAPGTAAPPSAEAAKAMMF